MLEINPKKFKHIKNKAIPSPLRPKFRNSGDTNIYFLSKKKFHFKNNKTFIKYSIIFILTAIIYLTVYLILK